MQTIDLPQERQQAILEELRLHGRVVASELSHHYGVSEDTIPTRSARPGICRIIKNGCTVAPSPIAPNNIPFMERDKQNPISKVRLAQAARELVRNGQLISARWRDNQHRDRQESAARPARHHCYHQSTNRPASGELPIY